METSTEVQIRPEQSADLTHIFEIHCQAFGQTEEGHIVNRLRKGPAFLPELSLVAWLDARPVGHIIFSRIDIMGESQQWGSLALAPMAVLPEFQKQGIGGQLIRTGLQSARDLGFDSVVVLGHADYYPRFGFQKAASWGIKCPFPVPDEVYMALELKQGALEGKAGLVRYDAAFSAD